MKRTACVEFYRAKNAGYAWRLRAGNAFIAPRVYRLRDLEGNKDDLIRMLERA